MAQEMRATMEEMAASVASAGKRKRGNAQSERACNLIWRSCVRAYVGPYRCSLHIPMVPPAAAAQPAKAIKATDASTTRSTVNAVRHRPGALSSSCDIGASDEKSSSERKAACQPVEVNARVMNARKIKSSKQINAGARMQRIG